MGSISKVGISPLLVINTSSFDVVLCVLWHLMFLMAIGEAEKCLAGCQVTKCKFNKSFFFFAVLTTLVLWIVKK